ncbi:MAG: metallophosphoesterase family protein [Nanoarchaeota archaeon]
MRFLIFGDLHGAIPDIKVKQFDAVIATGDFCSNDLMKDMFAALRNKMDDESSKSWYDAIGRRIARKKVKKSLADGRRVLEFLNSLEVPVYVVPGNWDWTAEPDHRWTFLRRNHYASLLRGLSNIHDVHRRTARTGCCSIIGYGISSGPELPLEGIFTEEEWNELHQDYRQLKRKYTARFKRAKDPVIFLSHNVPFSTPLDIIRNPESPRHGEHMGSLLVRELCEQQQPLVCIAGHMHEHFKKTRIDETVALNAGAGPGRNIVLEIEDGKIQLLRFLRK